MATRRPLVIVDGQVQELPSGDIVSGAGSGAIALASVTLDFGSVPTDSKAFSITDAAVTTLSKVVMVASPDGDEYEMDGFSCAAHCAVNGTILAYIHAHPGPVSGTRKFQYLVS